MASPRRVGPWLALLLVACGRGQDGAPAWTRLDPGALGTVQAGQRERALAARDALFGRLSARLTAAIGEVGPAAAVSVCREEAPALARAVAAETGVRIGRTSVRLRNAANAPPAWAVPFVAGTEEQDVFLGNTDGRLAALLPVRLQEACLACHGPALTLADDVRAALAKAYPGDRATGFAAGELRGWFWLEIPAP